MFLINIRLNKCVKKLLQKIMACYNSLLMTKILKKYVKNSSLLSSCITMCSGLVYDSLNM